VLAYDLAPADQSEVVLSQLRLAREEARRAISSRIEIGRHLFDNPIGGAADVSQMEQAVRLWGDENQNLLRRLFDAPSAADEYARRRPRLTLRRTAPLMERAASIAKALAIELVSLEVQLDALGLVHEAERDASPTVVQSVFLVHGHDEAALHEVARFVSEVGLHPRVLRELPDSGRTIIEKFEDYATTTYAIVLLTPDDTCEGAAGASVRRARQNVILEMGYFIGRLGRHRVCTLYRAGTEIPSDYNGVLFVPLDPEGGWRWRLARELRAAKLPIDVDRALT